MKPSKTNTKEDWIKYLLLTIEKKDAIIEKQSNQISKLISIIPESKSNLNDEDWK